MRHTGSFGLLVLFAACQTGIPPSPTHSANAEREVLSAEHDWVNATARQDADAFASHLDDKWVGLTDGRLLEKAAWVSSIRTTKKQDETMELANLKVRFSHPDVAVVTGDFVNKIRLGTSDKITAGKYIDTWVRIGGRWQLVSSGFATILKSP
jgi:ketosteroid isomerase-like protein